MKVPPIVVVVFGCIAALVLIIAFPGYGGMIGAGVVRQVAVSQVTAAALAPNFGGSGFDAMCKNGSWNNAAIVSSGNFLANQTCEAMLVDRDINVQVQSNSGLAALVVTLGVLGLVIAMIVLSVKRAKRSGE